MKATEADSFDDVNSVFRPRFSSPFTRWLLLGWTALFAVLMLQPLAGYLDFFAERDPRFRWALAVLLIGLVVASWIYARLRVRALWRREPTILLGIALALLLIYVPWGLAIVTLLGASSFVAGKEIAARAGLAFETTSAELAVSLGAGLSLLIVSLIPLGLAGLYGPTLFVILLAVPLVVCRRRIRDLWDCVVRLDRAWLEAPESRSTLVGIAIVFAGVFEVVLLLAAVTPTITNDAIAYHVPAAQHYLASGRLEPVPSIEVPIGRRDIFSVGHSTSYSYYPQSFEELLAVAMSLGGWPAMQLISPLFGLLALLSVSSIGAVAGLTRLERLIGLVGAFTLPFAHWSASTIKNDLATASFQLLALYAVLQARERRPAAWLLFGASFLGLSFGFKHIAIFGGIPIGLLLAHEIWKREHRWRQFVLAGLLFAASGTFWHARAFVLKGSPVYPANASVAVRQFNATDRSKPPRSQVYFTYLWMAHFEGSKVIELPMPNPCGLFLAFLAIAWPLTRGRPSRTHWALAFYFALYYAYWIWVWGVLRYGIAPFFVLAMLTGGRAASLWAQGGRIERLTLSSAMTLGLLVALPPTLGSEVNAPQMRYLAGVSDRNDYLEEANRFYPSIRELSRLMQPGDSAISVSNCAVAYSADPTSISCLEVTTQAALDRVVEAVRHAKPDYLLVSNRAAAGSFAPIIAESYSQPIYTDPIFEIYAASREAE